VVIIKGKIPINQKKVIPLITDLVAVWLSADWWWKDFSISFFKVEVFEHFLEQ
jgi:hypothetical protein